MKSAIQHLNNGGARRSLLTESSSPRSKRFRVSSSRKFRQVQERGNEGGGNELTTYSPPPPPPNPFFLVPLQLSCNNSLETLAKQDWILGWRHANCYRTISYLIGLSDWLPLIKSVSFVTKYFTSRKIDFYDIDCFLPTGAIPST